MNRKIAIIGDTQDGGYGHSLDQAFVSVEGAKIVALADPDEAGRTDFMGRTGAINGYADYTEMLKTERPDIVVVATHEMSHHLAMVIAAAEQGAHIYAEKPLARTPAEVDQMLEACDRAGVMLVMAHPWRGRPEIQNQAIPMIKEGKIGTPRWARMYGFGGEHGGDQWFIDLYPHFFDFLWQVFGQPLWCQALITQDGQPATPADIKEGLFGMGLSAGNGIWAHYQFEGFNVEFESYAGDGIENPYRIDIHGTAGTLILPGPTQDGPDIYYHPHSNPQPVGDDRWEILAHEEVSGGQKWINAHHRMSHAMLDILDGKTPEYELCLGQTARHHMEMAMAARLSHIRGARVVFPMEETGNPLETW
jgi:predicted dehydrogenase